jgi:hypothetical protein
MTSFSSQTCLAPGDQTADTARCMIHTHTHHQYYRRGYGFIKSYDVISHTVLFNPLCKRRVNQSVIQLCFVRECAVRLNTEDFRCAKLFKEQMLSRRYPCFDVMVGLRG